MRKEYNVSFVQHFDLNKLKVKCDDNIIRTVMIIDMPFKGNEHQFCTLRTKKGKLHAVWMSEMIKVLGKDPRRF
jgi:hypothetical protein